MLPGNAAVPSNVFAPKIICVGPPDVPTVTISLVTSFKKFKLSCDTLLDDLSLKINLAPVPRVKLVLNLVMPEKVVGPVNVIPPELENVLEPVIC